jgi:hypothetical protein
MLLNRFNEYNAISIEIYTCKSLNIALKSIFLIKNPCATLFDRLEKGIN